MTNGILVAVDGSENADRAVAYVGRMLRHAPDSRITLLHVLQGLPPQYLEHGGSEHLEELQFKDEQLRRQIDQWVRSKRTTVYPVLARAQQMLEQAGISAERIETRLVDPTPHVPIERRILEEARAGEHYTIVVGRRGISMLEKLLFGSVTEGLLKGADGFTVWVVQ